MRIIPSSAREWWNFILFPFKAYIVVALLLLVIAKAMGPSRFSPVYYAHPLVGIIYLISMAVLILSGLVLLFTSHRDSVIFSLILGAIALFFSGMLLPAI